MANFWKLLFELNAVGACLAWKSFETDSRTEKIYRAARLEIHFLQGVRAVAVVNGNTPCYGCEAVEVSYTSFFLLSLDKTTQFTAIKINESVGKSIWKASKIMYVIRIPSS